MQDSGKQAKKGMPEPKHKSNKRKPVAAVEASLDLFDGTANQSEPEMMDISASSGVQGGDDSLLNGDQSLLDLTLEPAPSVFNLQELEASYKGDPPAANVKVDANGSVSYILLMRCSHLQATVQDEAPSGKRKQSGKVREM